MLTKVYRDPVDTFREFRGELDRIFNPNVAGYTDTSTDWMPAVDVKESQDAYQVVADLPGVEPKDIDVSLEDGVLTVKGERKPQSENKTENGSEAYTRSERSYGSFCRSFTLPDTADADNISAKTEHGVLKLHIPKKEKVLPKKISVAG